MNRSSHFEVTTRNGKWVVMECFGAVERVAYEAATEAEAEELCREYNDRVEFPIA